MANKTALSRMKMPAEEVIGRHLSTLMPVELAQTRQAFLTQAINTRQLVEFEDQRAGIVFHHTFYPVIDTNGCVTGVVAFSGDITERKQIEETLRESEKRYRELVQYAPAGIYEVDFHTRKFTFVNDAMCQILGYTREEVLKLDPFDLLIPESQALFRKRVQEWLAGEKPEENVEYRVKKKDGSEICVLLNVTFTRDVNGVPLGATVIGYDITEHRQAEEALLAASLQKQAAEYVRTLLEVSLDPLVTISPEGKITDVNEATVKATGVPREELLGTDFSRYFTEPDVAEQGYRQVFALGFVTDYPLTIRHRAGGLMDVLYNASLYKDAKGSVLGIFAAARDVTVQRQAEAELKRHRENLELLVKERTLELEASNRELARSNENLEQFAYVASHDLQEPLRIMSSYSQLLEKRYKHKLDQDADDFIEFIVEAAARMQKLIIDLVAYSRAGRNTTDLVEVDCNRLVQRLVAQMAVTIESVGGQVNFDRLPLIRAPESSILQLFQNLIGNALKFHGEQPPCIHLSARQADREWVFSVRDNGIGIEPQYLQRIFIIFQRLHTRDQYPGTGIGLSICKKIVENLGGQDLGKVRARARLHLLLYHPYPKTLTDSESDA